jgi:methyltransferase-like protein/2-polyprenyl-3-methyl-5-hydroxy-6-metoxy-1,4-benzoquinol methylase
MAENPGERTIYDVVGYPATVYLETHPARLEVVAALHGLKPTPARQARVLEVGSFDGANLIPLAYELEGAHFLGFDIAGEPIERGKQVVEQLGLKNIELRQQDLLQFNSAVDGMWDYIIVHGLYSWVPVAMRKDILKLCRDALSPHGVAFISFNAYPGSFLRDMVHSILEYHVEGVTEPEQRVGDIMNMIRLLAENAGDETRHREVLQNEFKDLAVRSPQAVFHDELAPEHHPLYFHEFASQIAEAGLQYVGEAQPFENQSRWWSDEMMDVLRKVEEERGYIAREQYMDFLKNRRFRLSLVTHAEAPVSQSLSLDTLASCYFGSTARPEGNEADLAPGVNVEFKAPGGIAVETDSAIAKAALLHLQASWPEMLSFDNLRQKARALVEDAVGHDAPGYVGPDEDHGSLLRLVSHMYLSGLMDIRSTPPKVTNRAGEYPTASPIARLQAAAQAPAITTLHHQTISLDDSVGRYLIQIMDGTRTHEDIIKAMLELFRATPQLQHIDETLMATQIWPNISSLAKLGILVA